MNIFIKKFKKANKVERIFFLLSIILYIPGFILFTYNILKLSGIETGLRITSIVFFSLWMVLYILYGLVSMFKKKNKTFITLTVFNTIFTLIIYIAIFVLSILFGSISTINQEYIVYTTNLITLNETNLNSDSKIGMINNEDDPEGNILAKKLIEKEKLKYEVVEYGDVFEMVLAMYQKEIDGVLISSNFEVNLQANETFKNIGDEVKVVHSYSEKMKNKDNELKSEKKLTEPFTMLVMGVDSKEEGLEANQAFNGDTLILITFNPKTLTSTMLSIPRDMYVPIGCGNGAYAKINSSAAYGTQCVINTIEKMTDIKIDYFLKINFKGVISLVNALGGIKVNVEAPYSNKYNGRVCESDENRQKGEHLICMDPGWQTLNGEQALAYARCRYLYLLSDIDRNRHQQDIIEAIAQALKGIDSIKEIQAIIDTVSNNINSNMTKDQILSFYDVCKTMLQKANISKDSLVTIKKTYLEYYDLPVYLPAYGVTTSALGYYQGSLDAIVREMKINLELEEAEMQKTFEIDFNEDYKVEPIGKGIRTGNRIETFPSLIGESQSYAQSWCNGKGISASFKEGNSFEPYGTIIDQSVKKNTLLSRVNSVTFTISNGQGTSETENEVTE